MSELTKLSCISYERFTGTSIELHRTRFEEDLLQYSTQRRKSSQLEYWYTALELECLVLLLVCSIREGNFDMFVEALEQLIPMLFSLDHPNVFENLKASRFTVQKTNRVFSRISDDHAHEQNNKIIKMEGGANWYIS